MENSNNTVFDDNSRDSIKFPEEVGGKDVSDSDLISELLKKQIISRDQLEVALKEQRDNDNKVTIAAILTRMGFVSQSTLSEILNKSSNVKNISLKSIIIDQSLIKKVPKSFAMQNLVIPISTKDDTVVVAIADIFNIITIDQIKRFFPKCKIFARKTSHKYGAVLKSRKRYFYVFKRKTA